MNDASIPGPQGARGEEGQQGRPGGLRELPAATRRSIVFLFVIAAGFGVFNTLWTGHQVNHAAAVQRADQRQFAAAQRREQQRYEAAQRAAAAAAAKAQILASVPACQALRKLSEIHGSHGTSAATYGIHLEAGFKDVYAKSKCPQALALARKATS